MATETSPPVESEPEKKGGFKFPTAYTVLFFVLLLVFALTFVIKPGSYSYVSCDGGNAKPIPGSYEQIDTSMTFKERLYDLWLSPVNGLYGIREVSEPVEEVTPEQQAVADETCEGAPAESSPHRATPGRTTRVRCSVPPRCSSSCWRSVRSSRSPSRPGRSMPVSRD